MSMTSYRIDGATRVAVLAVLCALGLALISVCAGSRIVGAPDRSGRTPLDALTKTFDAQEVVAFIGQPFPAGATDLHVTGESALDTIVIARFDAPREDIVAWLADLGITEPLVPGYSPFFSSDPPLDEAAGWWEPAAAGSEPPDYDGVYQRVSQKTFNVVVTPLENGLVRVHLQVFNT